MMVDAVSVEISDWILHVLRKKKQKLPKNWRKDTTSSGQVVNQAGGQCRSWWLRMRSRPAAQLGAWEVGAVKRRAFVFNWISGKRSRLEMWIWGLLAQLRYLSYESEWDYLERTCRFEFQGLGASQHQRMGNRASAKINWSGVCTQEHTIIVLIIFW